MPNSDVGKIKKFFTQDSLTRDEELSLDPILSYEDNTRRNSISALIAEDYFFILDAGCGNGRDFEILSNSAQKLVGVDFSPGMIREAKFKAEKLTDTCVHLVASDITSLPFKDNSFDLIVCSEVLEHVPEWLKAISEFHRLLKPSGDLIISTPNKYSMYGLTRYTGRLLVGSKHPYDKWKSYFELRNALQNAGFKVTTAKGSCYLPGDISYFRPFKKVVIYLLGFARFLERVLSSRWPFNLLGYHIVIKAREA